MSSLYAVVDLSGNVINLVEWDGVTPYNVAPNTLVLATSQPNAQIGGTYVGGVFTAPATPPPAQDIGYVNSPTNGATVTLPTLPRPQNRLFAYLQPAAALSALTIDMPPGSQDNDEVNLQSAFAVTGLVFSPTWTGAPNSLVAGSAGKVRFIYSAQLGAWFQW
jgi:hypothetical protein